MVDRKAEATAFRRLHDEGTFVLPNAWDTGSAADDVGAVDGAFAH